MRNKLLLLFVISGIAKQTICQKQGQHKMDSLLFLLKTGKEDTSKVNTLNALALELKNNTPDSSIYFLSQSLQLATKLNYELGIANAKSYKGLILSRLGEYEEGLQNCTDAVKLYDQLLMPSHLTRNSTIMDQKSFAYNTIGIIYATQGNYPEGLKNFLVASKISGETGDKKMIGETQNNLGILYYYQRNYARALEYYSASLKIREEIGDTKGTADCYNNIGVLYENQDNYPEALKSYLRSLKLAENIKDKDGIAVARLNIGIIKTQQGKYDEGLNDLLASLRIAEELGNRQMTAGCYENIGLNYTEQRKFKEAYYYLDSALSLAKEIGGLDEIREYYKDLAFLDSTAGNYKQSLRHYKLHVTYRDSLYNEENTKKIVQAQMLHDFDKKESLLKAEQERKDAISKKEFQRQKLVRNGFVGGFAVVMLFAAVFFTQRNRIKKGKKRSDELLLNILPSEVAEELKQKGSADAKQFDSVTVMFTDFKNFTKISENLSPTELVAEIDYCFKGFDRIITQHNIEKIKTIGDSYMCAGGLPVANTTNAADVVSAALDIQQFMKDHMEKRKKEKKEPFEIRIGVHSGPVVAGIVGVKKFAYDIWGDTVNIASRMESSGEEGKVNISGSTYDLIKDKFSYTYRGKIHAKNKGEIEMYFVERVS